MTEITSRLEALMKSQATRETEEEARKERAQAAAEEQKRRASEIKRKTLESAMKLRMDLCNIASEWNSKREAKELEIETDLDERRVSISFKDEKRLLLDVHHDCLEVKFLSNHGHGMSRKFDVQIDGNDSIHWKRQTRSVTGDKDSEKPIPQSEMAIRLIEVTVEQSFYAKFPD
ncbi:MAG TPA: hypothetical protein V6C97_09625 [Oculatellaceae cyanobacterium]